LLLEVCILRVVKNIPIARTTVQQSPGGIGQELNDQGME
jgi:hypothetical protein